MALQGFDEAYYLSAKLSALAGDFPEWATKTTVDLKAYLANVGFTPESHYSQFGYTEGLAPNAYFNHAEYKLAKAWQLFNSPESTYVSIAEALAAFEQAWTGDAYQHYLQYGAFEEINPSNAFDAPSYLADKLADLQADSDTAAEWADKDVDDLLAAFEAAGFTPLTHYIAFGEGEGLTVTEVPAGEQVDPDELDPVEGETFTLTTGTDSITGTTGNDTINGTASTLTALDAIDGGAGTDTLLVNDAAAAMATTLPAGMSISNVEKMTINTSGGLGLAGSTATAAVAQVNTYVFSNGTAGGTMTVNYGTLSSSITTAGTSDTLNADLFVAAINAMAGSTIAVNAAGTVTVTAPVAGTALPGITFSGAGAAAEAPTVTLTTPNVAASGSNVTAASYDLSGISSLTDITVTAAGASDVKVSDTANITLTTTTGAVSITGGKAVTTSGATGAVAITGAAGIASATVTGGTTATIADNGTEADTLTTVSVSGLTGATTISSDALNTLSVANSNQNVTVTAAAATRALDLTVNKLTGGTIADAQATSLALTSTGTASSGITVSTAKATTISVAGDKAVSFALAGTGASQADNLAITVTNTAGATITTQLDNDVTFTGGAGADSVVIEATTKAIAMGGGNDTVTLATGTTALGTAGSVDAGAGDADVLKFATYANAVSASGVTTFEASISGFERLELAGVNGATAAAIDLANLDDINYVILSATNTDTTTISNFTSGGTLVISADQTDAKDVTVAVKDAATSTADVFNISLTKAAGAALATVDVTAASIETINISSDDTATTASGIAHALDLNATSVKTVTVTGDAGVDFTGSDLGTALTSFDASGVTKGAVTVTTGALANVATLTGGAGNDVINAALATKAVTIAGNAGDDNLTGSSTIGSTLNGGAGNDTLNGGAGADTLNGGDGTDTIVTGAGLDIVTGGAGSDVFTVGLNANGNTYATITDFTATVGSVTGDVINLSNLVLNGNTTATLATAVTLAGTAAFADFLNAATAGHVAAATNAVTTWFQYGGDTYVVVDNNNADTFTSNAATGDQVVKLTGLVDLEGATITSGTDLLTLVA